VTGEGQSFDRKMAVTPSRWRTKLEGIAGDFGILDLDPMPRRAGPVRTLSMLRNQALKPHQAGVPVQVRAYLALLKVAQEDAVHSARQKGGEADFSCRVPGCRTRLPP
jgi:hypothetical protein